MKRHGTILLAVAIAVLIAVAWYAVTARTIQTTNPLARDAIAERDYGKIARAYLQGDLAIEERPWHGNPNAPITILIMLDLKNELSAETLAVVAKRLENRTQVDAVRIGLKYAITDAETGENEDSFIYAATARCLEERPSWMDEITTLIREPETLADIRDNISETMLAQCASQASLIEDRFHTATSRSIAPSVHVGTNTRSMTVLYGVPDAQELEQAIRSYEIRFGI